MTELNENEIRARFESLRNADEAHAPAFRAVLERESARTPRPKRLPIRWKSPVVLSLAAAAAILVAVSVARNSASSRDFVAKPLSTWTSPTASLLRSPSSGLLRSPTLMPSVLDRIAYSPVSR